MTAVAQGFRVRNIAQNKADEIENGRKSRLGPVQSGEQTLLSPVSNPSGKYQDERYSSSRQRLRLPSVIIPACQERRVSCTLTPHLLPEPGVPALNMNPRIRHVTAGSSQRMVPNCKSVPSRRRIPRFWEVGSLEQFLHEYIGLSYNFKGSTLIAGRRIPSKRSPSPSRDRSDRLHAEDGAPY